VTDAKDLLDFPTAFLATAGKKWSIIDLLGHFNCFVKPKKLSLDISVVLGWVKFSVWNRSAGRRD
jgi:hypothetical protein